MTIAASDETQEIDYRSCDTIEIRIPKQPPAPEPKWYQRAWRMVADRWEDIWPPLVGIVLGTGIATALLLLAALWWLNA